MAYVVFGLLAVAGALRADHVAGLIIGGGIFLLCAPFIWRAGLYATSDGLACLPISGKQITYSWADIKEFRVARSNRSSGLAIHAVLIDGRDVQLPAAAGPAFQRARLERVCAKLTAAKADADALHPTVPQHSLATDLAAKRADVASQRAKLALLCPIGIGCGIWGMLDGGGVIVLIGFGALPFLVLLPTQLQLRLLDRRLEEIGQEPGQTA